MDPLLVLIETNGYFTRAQARDLGWDDRAVGHAMRSGMWHRIRRGYYTYSETWSGLEAEQRHVVRARAVMHSLGPDVVLSHASGCAVHRIAMWDIDLRRVHVTRLDGGPGRIEGDVVHHEGFVADHEVVSVDGLQVLVPARCALEAASRATNEQGLVILDSLLAGGRCDQPDLVRQFEQMAHWPFTRHLHVVVRMANGRSMSPGESRGRWLFRCSGIPAPVLQYEVRGPDGLVMGTTDWAWPDHGALGEFDGFVKYSKLLEPGADPSQVVFAEKQREELLCRLSGLPRMVRIVWADYDRPRVTAGRVTSALDLAS
jgi:hypothetical protein